MHSQMVADVSEHMKLRNFKDAYDTSSRDDKENLRKVRAFKWQKIEQEDGV